MKTLPGDIVTLDSEGIIYICIVVYYNFKERKMIIRVLDTRGLIYKHSTWVYRIKYDKETKKYTNLEPLRD